MRLRKLYEHPIFIQLVVFTVLIGIVPLILISGFVFYKMADMAREEVMDSHEQVILQYTDGVEEKLNFELTTGDIGLDGAEDRYLSRLTLRLDAECSSTVEVAASYDGGPWETVASLTAQDKRRSFDLPFVPRRHGTLRLRLKGRGQITLRSIAKTMAAAKGGIAGGEV